MAASKGRGAGSAAAKKAVKGAAKGAARSASKGAAKAASKAASKAAGAAASAGGDRIGRGTRWTEEQVKLLLDTVGASSTAKQGFEAVASELGKSVGTVQQKYYNLQKASSGGGAASGTRRRGRPRGSGTARAAAAPRTGVRSTSGLPSAAQLRELSVDELVAVTKLVKAEVERRRTELDAASALLPS